MHALATSYLPHLEYRYHVAWRLTPWSALVRAPMFPHFAFSPTAWKRLPFPLAGQPQSLPLLNGLMGLFQDQWLGEPFSPWVCRERQWISNSFYKETCDTKLHDLSLAFPSPKTAPASSVFSGTCHIVVFRSLSFSLYTYPQTIARSSSRALNPKR